MQALTPALARQLRLDATPMFAALVIGAVDPNSDAGQKGIQAGRRHPVDQPAADPDPGSGGGDRRGGTAGQRNTVLLQIRRGNGPPGYFGVELSPRRRHPGSGVAGAG